MKSAGQRENDDGFLSNQAFSLAEQLAISRGDGLGLFSLADTVLLRANDTYISYFTPPYNERQHIIGQKAGDIFSGQSLDLFKKMKSHVIRTGQPFYAKEAELERIFFGTTYWDISLIPIVEEGKIKYLMSYLSNETEKVLNRKAITERNEELESVISNISDEIIIFDKDFNVTTSNRTISRSSAAQKSSENFSNINVAAKHVQVFDQNNQIIALEDLPYHRVARGETVSDFFIKTVSDGEELYSEIFGTPIYDDQGNFSRGVVIFRNIKDRIKEEELKLIEMQKEPLTRVIEAMELEYIRCAYPDLEILSINEQAVNKLRQINSEIESPNQVIGKSCYDFYPIDIEKKKKDLEFHLVQKGDSSYVDYESYMIAGEERFFKTINEPIVGFNNKVLEVIFITIDMTDQVKERNKMEETLEMQNQMFTTISHELKTPLNVIFSAAQLMELDLQEEISQINQDNISKGISIIKQNCHRFTKIINNIIDLSRMESGFFKLNYSNENIVYLVEDMVDSMRDYVENAGLYILFDTEIEEKIMAVDVNQIERIILNLISNAVKFSPTGETIYIDIKDRDDHVLIQVGDRGEGISKKHLSKIFEKYKKVDNSLSRNAEGSGIGLSLVKNIVTLMGGEISVESELAKGSVFTVALPVDTAHKLEMTDNAKRLDNRDGQLNIEFSDVYVK